MTTSLGWLLIVLAGSFTEKVIGGETCQDPDRLIVCHIETELNPSTDPCSCTHIVIHRPHDTEVIKAAGKLREKNRRLKILSLAEEGKKSLLEDGVSGVYLRLSKSLSKELVIKNVKALATELDNLQASKRANAKYSSESSSSSSKDVAEIILELPSSPEQLAKNYDLKSLNKYVNYFIISSDNLTDSSEEGLAYHPSRLMGIDDILNADSLVDLISGLGAEHEKLLVSLPATALKFNLKDPKDNMPRAKVTGPPESISQKELCSLIENGVWTLERDEDLTAPYAYSNTTWLAFDDSVSAAIKAKYILLRGLAGISVTKSEADDWGHVCASRPILDTIYSTFTNLVRKPRAATLLSLQDQIHNSISPFAGDIQLSPYRIVRVVDRAGSVHVVRKEAKTEFQCSRQGYFTHPSGCNRFYRCVKFNQYSSDFTVFEYDCPAGLAFDERYEVCVWPGSLPDASACKGSSEIAPVPRSRYACSAQGYFADPENCRWFFACLDHHGDGRAPTAYEFRCPFGLVFNEKTLTCDWPWSVPGCGSGSGSVIHTSSIYPGDILEGRLRPAYAQVSDLHVSGGRIADVDGGLVLGTNLLSGISTSGQRYSNGYGYGLANQINSAFGNSKYEDNSGAYIHDPTGDTGGEYIHEEGSQGPHGTGSAYSTGHGLYGISNSGTIGISSGQYVHSDGSQGTGSYSSSGALGGHYTGGNVLVSGGSTFDNSGAYVHDSRGDSAGQYVHSDGSQGAGSYSSSGASGGYYTGGKVLVSGGSALDNSGAYVHDARGDSAGQYVHSEGSQGAGSYSSSGASGGYYTGGNVLVSGGTGLDNSGAYVHDSRGDSAGQYIHSAGAQGSGSYSSSGASSGDYAGGKVLVSGGTGLDNSGAYVHDSRGDSAGQYIHSAGAQVSGSYSSSGASSGDYAGGKVLVNSGTVIDNSGAYVHDSRGDTGGAYVHQEGPDGPGSRPYLHSGSSSIQYGNAGGQFNAYEHDNRGETAEGFVNQVGISNPSSVIYSGIKTSGSGYSEYHQSGVGPAVLNSKSPNTLSAGAYIHDARGDAGGAYVHQQGSSGSGSIPHFSGGVKTSQGYFTDYAGVHHLGAGGFSGGSYSTNSGQYIHDSTGDKGGDYVHQEGPSGPGSVPYVHQEGANVESGLRGDLNIKTGQSYTTNYIGQNIVGIGGFTADSHTSTSNNGQYIHDSRGDSGGAYVHQEGPSYYQGLYAGRYSGHYIHDNSGSYVHGSNGFHNQPHLNQESPRGPLYQDVNIYNSQYAGQYASKYAEDQKHLYHYGSTNIDGAHLYQSGEGVIHTYDTSRLHVQPLGYKGSVKYSSSVTNIQPISVTTPGPTILSEIKTHEIQPITVTEKPTVPLNPVQYITPLNGIKTNGLQSLSLIKGSQEISHSYISPITGTKTISLNPVQYHQDTTVNTGVSGYEYSKPKITFSYPEHVVKHHYTVQPTPTSYLTKYSYHPSVPIQSVNTLINQPVIKTNVVSPVFVSSTLRPDLVSYKEPIIDSHIVQPVSVTSPPIVPLNPVQYGTKIETVQVSSPAPPTVVSSYSYNPVIKTQTVRPIVVSSTPAIPLSPIQYGIKVHTFEGSTPAPPQVSSQSYNPVIKTQTVHPVIISSAPAVPLNPVQYGIKTISNSVGYHYSKPIVGLSYPKDVYSTQAPPVISYTYQKPLIKTQPIHPVVSTPALPDVSISHEVPIQKISISNPPTPSFGYSYKQPIKPVIPVSVSTPAPPVVSYSYQQPLKPVVPISISTSSPTVVSYSTTPRPIIVSSTPKVPLNPIQYVNPVSISSPVSPTFGYSYKQPIKPSVIAVSTPAPPVISYSYKQPIKPVAFNTPSPPANSYSTTVRPIVVSSTPSVPLNPVQYVNRNPIQPEFGYSYQRPIVPVSVSTPAPPIVSYSYQQPAKPLAPILVSTPAPPVVSYSTTPRPIIVSSTPKVPLNPVQYINSVSISTPAPTFGYSYNKPIKSFVSVNTPSPQIVTYSYQQPIKPAVNIGVSTPAPPVVNYSYRQPVKPVAISTPAPPSYSTTLRPIVVSSTPTIPLNPVQYVNPVSISTPAHPTFGYSYKQPIKPIVPVSVSTPAPYVNYKQPIVPISFNAPSQQTFEYSYKQPINPTVHTVVTTPAPPVVSYSTTVRPIQPIAVSSTPVVPLNPVQYINPVSVGTPVEPTFGYSYKKPLKPVTPVTVGTPAPVVSYSYQQPIKTVRVNTPAPPVISYSTTVRPVQRVVVSSTPSVPLNPVQYFNPISASTPAPPVSGYSYEKPAKPLSLNVPVSTFAPHSVSYSYKQQVPVSTPAPATVDFSYHQSVKSVYSPEVRYQTPKPVAPIFSYSYQNPTTPAPSVIVSTPAPFTSHSLPVQHLKQVYPPASPINKYTYRQPLAPVSVNSPAPPSFTYSRPVPFSTSPPALLNYSYNAKDTQSISVSSTPNIPLNPVQYVKHVTTSAPTVSYSYRRPLEQSADNKATNIVFSYTFDSKPVRPVTVSSTPAIPLNPVQYSTTPVPAVTYRPVSTYSTPSVPVINYSYQPSLKPVNNRPLQPAVVTTHAPEINYSYQEEPDYFLKLKTVRPVSVTSTPAVPLNPVQYVSTTPRPIINYQYQNPVIKTHTSVVAPSVDYYDNGEGLNHYDEGELHREISKIQPKPSVASFYEAPTRTTTLAPITVTSTPLVPLNPVQYVKHSQPVFSYTYNYAKPASYNTKGCCSSPSLKVSPTPQPTVFKTTTYPSTIISTKKPVVGAYFEENYEANRQEEGYVYSRPNIKLEETPITKNIYSTPSPYNNPSKFTTSTYLQRPVQTYANTVEEESYISNTPEHVTTLVKQPISVETNDEDLNLHLDIPKIGVNKPIYTTTSTPQQQIVEVTTVTPVVKRVRVKGGLTRGGYYVRRQKVKVQPVITTTENYPAYFTSTIKPIYSSTIDLSSPTLYSTTVRPSTIYTTSSTTSKDDELEVEDEDYDAKLLEQVSGQFGEIINTGNQGIIRQGFSTTTVSSLKDGETIVGVVKKERVAGGRNKAKVVVVSKLSDFNPLLIGKLGAECSCKSNSKTLNLQRGSSGNRGQLFYPEVQNAGVPSREYLPTSSEPPKVNDYYLPASQVPFVNAKASTTVAPSNYDDQSYVEIRPINKVQKFYTSTGPAIDTISTEYDTTTKRSIGINKVGIIQEKTLEKGASFDRYGPGGLRGSDETLQGSVDCQRAGLFRHPKYCNKFYSCNWDQWKKRFTLHVFNCPIHLAYDSQLGACNWPSKGPACADDNLLV